ncbi:MAG: lytic transglycosylase domain-containing protein [Pyrinomonadaceae bacterium]
MRRFPFVILLALACFIPASAQNRTRYSFDNFDTRTGVRVESVVMTATLPPAKTIRSTAKISTAAGGADVRAASSLYVQPRRSVAMTVSKSLDGFTTGNATVDSYIVESGARNGVDPVLLYSVMHQESSFKPGATSNKGARGLMQLMPGTAARFGVANIYDPRQNIEGGARYIRLLLNMFQGDVALALAGYNAGEGAVLKYGRNVPPYRETQEYVRRIAQRYTLMRDPQTSRNARTVTRTEVAAVKAEEPVPLTVYERNVFAVRMPDGRLQLVSQ